LADEKAEDKAKPAEDKAKPAEDKAKPAEDKAKPAEDKAGGAACKNPPKAAPGDGAGVPAKAEEGAPAKAEGKAGEGAAAGPEDGEPEPRTYTPEEIEEISRKAESYRDSTPPYAPTRVLSPEYGGTSNYERGIGEFRAQKAAELERLRADPAAPRAALEAAEEGVRKLDHLYENYHLGMNVFRTAKGGRSKLRE